jgi:hypothetical protein
MSKVFTHSSAQYTAAVLAEDEWFCRQHFYPYLSAVVDDGTMAYWVNKTHDPSASTAEYWPLKKRAGVLCAQAVAVWENFSASERAIVARVLAFRALSTMTFESGGTSCDLRSPSSELKRLSYDQQSQSRDRQSPSGDQQSPGRDRQSPGGDWQSPGRDRQSPSDWSSGGDRSSPSGDRRSPSGLSPNAAAFLPRLAESDAPPAQVSAAVVRVVAAHVPSPTATTSSPVSRITFTLYPNGAPVYAGASNVYPPGIRSVSPSPYTGRPMSPRGSPLSHARQLSPRGAETPQYRILRREQPM